MIATSATWNKWKSFLDNSKEFIYLFIYLSFCSYQEMLMGGILAIANADKKLMAFYNS
jgi:hypothetical protein